MLADWRVENGSEIYAEGDYVAAKIVEIDEEKQRFLLSLRQRDIPSLSIDDSIRLVTSYIEERSQIFSILKQREGTINSIQMYTVT